MQQVNTFSLKTQKSSHIALRVLMICNRLGFGLSYFRLFPQNEIQEIVFEVLGPVQNYHLLCKRIQNLPEVLGLDPQSNLRTLNPKVPFKPKLLSQGVN